jgi:hypothetical protein
MHLDHIHYSSFSSYKYSLQARVLYYTRLERLASNKHSRLFGQFTIYEENDVLSLKVKLILQKFYRIGQNEKVFWWPKASQHVAQDFSIYFLKTSGLYYKIITIVIMTIVSDAPNCGVTYDRN